MHSIDLFDNELCRLCLQKSKEIMSILVEIDIDMNGRESQGKRKMSIADMIVECSPLKEVSGRLL